MHRFVLRISLFDLLADYGIGEAESKRSSKCQVVRFNSCFVGLSNMYSHASIVAICNRLRTKTRSLPQNLQSVLRPQPIVAMTAILASRLKRLKLLVDRLV